MPKRRTPHEVFAVFDEARKSAQGGSAARKHHLVPASYLRRWEEDGQLRVTVIDEHRSYTQAAEKVARETDFYRIEHEDIDPNELPPLLLEAVLGRVENSAKQVIDALVAGQRADDIDTKLMAEFTWHLSLQITRGSSFRAEQRALLASMFQLQWANVSDEWIRERLESVGTEPTDAEVAKAREFFDGVADGSIVMAPQEAQVIGLAAQAAAALGEHLLFRNWAVFNTPPILVTCDEPVVVIGGPGWPRAEQSGVAVAAVILFPLSPSRLLTMFREDIWPGGPFILDHLETAEINREVIAAGHRWAFERQSRHVTERMHVPPLPEKLFVTEGPLPHPDGEDKLLYRNFRPNRWAGVADPPPWPVAKWWA